MRETRSSGSVRGASGNGRPYRARNRAVATHPGERPDSAYSADPWGRVWQRAGVRNGRADEARDPP